MISNVLYIYISFFKTKVYDKETKKSTIVFKVKSSIPLILRDMAPPEGSIFDPAKKWAEERERRKLPLDGGDVKEEDSNNMDAASSDKKKASSKKSTSGNKTVKVSAADTIKESNQAEKLKKELERDVQKLSNLKTLKALQDTTCDTPHGKIHRMLKMLHIAVSDLKGGVLGASEAEILDILWALEEMEDFSRADDELTKEKAAKKEAKDDEKDDKKSSKKEKDKEKDSKKKSKADEKTEKIVLSADAQNLKTLYKEGGDTRGSYKDSLKFARKLLRDHDDIITFQLTSMADRLPPLSRYNRKFKLEDWQCEVLEAIDHRQSAIVCAPTSSGKTLLSTYTCKNAEGTVLFVLPSEVLVWQIASTYYQFFQGNVTICTDQINFQEVNGNAQVYIGTPRALERALTKVRGCAGQEMIKGEREFTILDGGYNQFDYLVLDEVHTLNGPEGDALQRIIQCCNCPFLALSATIGNANELQRWFAKVRNDHVQMKLIDAPKKAEDVLLKEFSARFINLQRYVVTESESKEGKKKVKLIKLHPLLAMTAERLQTDTELIAALSMTPYDMVDLWKQLRTRFPSSALEATDSPETFFKSYSKEGNRITLNQTKEYESHLKKRLAALSRSYPDIYERFRLSLMPTGLRSQKDVSGSIYSVIDHLNKADLLPAVAFQLDTYGAFTMFKTLLAGLETEQTNEFPTYRKDLVKLAREKAAMRKVAAGKADRVNLLEAEEDAKAGFTDDLQVQEDTTRPHDKYVLAPAGKRLSYTEVEDIVADMKKSGEEVDIDHALIRGLRRGIAIYTNEVGFSCYRRNVQILAQKGRLAVVFSDSALAYGVNMPFRSCIFCGDMGSELSPLIAQQVSIDIYEWYIINDMQMVNLSSFLQMQGRAGRRGMDVQGNVVYLGMEWPYIENLMLGQISRVKGKEPRYPIMALQQVLCASNDPGDTKLFAHTSEDSLAFASALRKMQRRSQNCFPTVTEDMMLMMTKESLSDFCEQKESIDYFSLSTKVIQELGYIYEDMRLRLDHNHLTMIWEMHDYLPEAIALSSVLEQLYFRFCFKKTNAFMESDATQNEFISVILHVIDRVPVRPGDESLQELLRAVQSHDGNNILNEDSYTLWTETEATLFSVTSVIDSLDCDECVKAQMRLNLRPGTGIGPAIDKGVYELLVFKQKGFRDDQDLNRRNELKNRVVKLGEISLIAHNNLQQPHGKLSALKVHFRRLFSNIKYCVADMMNQLTDQVDVTDVY